MDGCLAIPRAKSLRPIVGGRWLVGLGALVALIALVIRVPLVVLMVLMVLMALAVLVVNAIARTGVWRAIPRAKTLRRIVGGRWLDLLLSLRICCPTCLICSLVEFPQFPVLGEKDNGSMHFVSHPCKNCNKKIVTKTNKWHFSNVKVVPICFLEETSFSDLLLTLSHFQIFPWSNFFFGFPDHSLLLCLLCRKNWAILTRLKVKIT